MYEPLHVLHAIDRNKAAIMTLCTGAMICNYAWFFAAVRQGFKDKVYPIPIVSTLFWLTGDASVVIRWLTGHDAYNHWYVRLFAMSLILTVICELTFLFLILKFGRKELMPSNSQAEFNRAIFAGLFVTIVVWTYINSNMIDPLNITYFNLANMIGPVASAALIIKRGSRAGTSSFIWWGYTAMLSFFYLACILFYGRPFYSPGYILFDAVNIASSAAVAMMVSRMPAVSASTQRAIPVAGGQLV
jgi:hypothetical protein